MKPRCGSPYVLVHLMLLLFALSFNDESVPRGYAVGQQLNADQKPLLELVMITLNEAAMIEQTIASVKPFIDRYTILDTGSTDGTIELIKMAFLDSTIGKVIH